MALNHVHLKVQNVEAVRAFYEAFFGFRLIERGSTEVYLGDAAGSWLTLSSANGTDVPLPEWFHFGFCYDTAKEVEVLYDRLKNANSVFPRELTRFAQDVVTFYVLDPSGNRIEVSWIGTRETCEHIKKAPNGEPFGA